MNTTHTTRREAFTQAFKGIALIALAGVAAQSSWAQSGKLLAKADVQYTDKGKDSGKDCDDCSQYIESKSGKGLGTCKIVEGAINPKGHCIAFTPKPKS